VVWLILPVGHDQGIRHFPWVTAGIAALCLLVQFQGDLAGPSADELQAAQEESTALEKDLLGPCAPQDCPALLHELAAGTLVPADDPRLPAWRASRERQELLLRRALPYRFAFRAAHPVSAQLLLSAFAHDGWMHLLGNLLFLYLVGCNLEDRWGRAAFSGLYLGGALASAVTFWLWHRGGEGMMVGASGAIAAAMGAFLICFHRAQIRFLIWSPFRRSQELDVAAYWVFPAWFLEQAVYSWLEARMNMGVAYSAHVGGFLFGLGVAALLRASGIEARYLLPLTAAGTEWREDPAYLAALDLLDQGDRERALPLLEAVLGRQHRHEGALEQRARATAAGEPTRAARATSAYLNELGRTRLAAVMPFADELSLWTGALPLDDRALGVLIRAAVAADQAERAVQTTRRLLAAHPRSQLIPGVLWEVARLQEKRGRLDLARTTLDQLIASYPDDPFAERARRLQRPAD
jgi:membrane associated rhomboid family serine protease